MHITFRNTALAALAATTLITGAASPALAGKSERAFLVGVLATAVVGGLIVNANKSRARSDTTPVYDNTYRRSPVSVRRDSYDNDRYERNRRVETRRELERYSSRSDSTPARYSPYSARLQPAESAFTALSYGERRRVQGQLARAGYYGYGIDGQWGPATERAVRRFAQDAGASAALNNPNDARRLYAEILRY